MRTVLRLGRPLFGVGVAALGLVCVAYRNAGMGLEAVPAAPRAVALLTGAVLIGSGASLVTAWHPRRGAGVLAAVLAFWLLALELPGVASYPGSPAALAAAIQTLALCAAACILWSALPAEDGRAVGARGGATTVSAVARLVVGASFMGLGVLDLLRRSSFAVAVPAWVPAPAFWPYATGLLSLAAGLGLAIGVKARGTGTVLGLVLIAWALAVDWPRVVASPRSQTGWMVLCFALALSGAVWLVADEVAIPDEPLTGIGQPTVSRRPRRPAHIPRLQLPDPRLSANGGSLRALSSRTDGTPEHHAE